MIRLNRTQLAEHMGVSTVAIDNWRREGMPVLQRGSRGVEWVFDLTAVIKWWGDRKVQQASGDAPSDLSEIEKRTASAKMQQAELDLAKAKGLVAPLDQIERNLARVFAEVRANMRNLPSVVISQLIGETDERKFKQVMLREIDQVLEVLADADLTAEPDDGDDGDEE
jgi:phage terminase Nu1 subunit (DNA packaging protein)